MLGIASLGALLWKWERSVNWTALVLAFLFGYMVRIVSTTMSAAIAYVMGFGETNLLWYFVIFTEVVFYFFAYKLIKLKNGIPQIQETEFKGIVFSFVGIILVFWGGYHMAGPYAYEVAHFLFVASMVALALVGIALICLIVYFAKKRRERLAFESKVQTLESQVHKLDDLETEQHKHRKTVSAVSMAHDTLLEELDALKSGSKMSAAERNKNLERIRIRLEAVSEFSAELGAEFALSDAAGVITLPDEWYPLQTLFEQTAKACLQQTIRFAAQNKTKTWDSIPLSKVDFTTLAGALLDNAIKELGKTEVASKQIAAKFSDSGGMFRFDLIDNAHEFPIEILEKLGERKNSTNGTGNGYAEVWGFLGKSKASFKIEEWQYAKGDSGKMISVIFDDKAKVCIESKYRRDLLKLELIETNIEVM